MLKNKTKQQKNSLHTQVANVFYAPCNVRKVERYVRQKSSYYTDTDSNSIALEPCERLLKYPGLHIIAYLKEKKARPSI